RPSSYWLRSRSIRRQCSICARCASSCARDRADYRAVTPACCIGQIPTMPSCATAKSRHSHRRGNGEPRTSNPEPRNLRTQNLRTQNLNPLDPSCVRFPLSENEDAGYTRNKSCDVSHEGDASGLGVCGRCDRPCAEQLHQKPEAEQKDRGQLHDFPD